MVKWWVFAVEPVGVRGLREVRPLSVFTVENGETQPDRIFTNGHILNEFVFFLAVDGNVVAAFVAAVDGALRPENVIPEQLVALVRLLQVRPPLFTLHTSRGRRRISFEQTDGKKNGDSDLSRQRHDGWN